MSDTGSRPDKWALLIGVNKYPKLESRYQLGVCANDVELMRELLATSFGFPEGSITLLRDEEATREGILAAMDALAHRVGRDDIVVFYFSGHGAQRRNVHSPRLEYESTIVPHDSGRGPDPDRDVTLREIAAWLLRLAQRTPNVTLILDSSHAGTFGSSLDPNPLSETRYVFIGGCRADEAVFALAQAAGVHSVPVSAFTYYLVHALRGAGPGASYRDVFHQVAPSVVAIVRHQHPQMEGAIDRPLFGVGMTESIRFVPIIERKNHEVVLAAGAAYNMTVGSQWVVYPGATDDITSETATVGMVEIEDVGTTESQAKILSEAEPQAVGVGAKAVELYHNYGEMRLVVEVNAPDGFLAAKEGLEALLKRSELLRVADYGAEANLFASVVLPGADVGEDDPIPQWGGIDEATWVVLETPGHLVVPTCPADPYKVPRELYENLEKLARYRNVLSLTNPNINSPLHRKVGLILLRQGPDGGWMTAKPDPQSGMIVFHEGERIAFRIVNGHTAPVYVSVLDLVASGSISLLHPLSGPSEAVGAGNSIEVGVREGDELELYLPDASAFEPDASGTDASVETFKLIATTYETDFFSLGQQDGYRAIEKSTGETTTLWRLLDMALTGWGIRESLPMDQDWTTVERTFVLRRGEGG